MKTLFTILLCAGLSAGAAMTEQVRDKVSHTFGRDTTLDVDNVNGMIEVIGDGGSAIRLEGERIIRADTKDEAERAKKEVTLDLNEKNGVAQVYVNGPFRGHGTDSHGFHEHDNDDRHYQHYQVIYNLTLHVPRETALEIRSVTGGIRVSGTRGKFSIRTVNGSVNASGIDGQGEIRTVNGAVTVAFTSTPEGSTSFEAVNGKIDVTLPADLKAELHLRTVNGSAFTDFDAVAPAGSRIDLGRRAGHSADLKVGGGGVALDFKTVNGGITIHKGGAK